MVKGVRVQNLRCHTDYFMSFDDGVNIVVGPNGGGKTTLLDAIYLSFSGKGYQSNKKELLKKNEKWFRIDVDLGQNVRVVKLQDGVFEHTIDEKQYKRLPKQKRLPVVMFKPTDVKIITGSPAGRRDYVDSLADIANQNHLTTVNRYNKVVQQRNQLLKTATNYDQLLVWDIQLAKLSSIIVANRQHISGVISESLNKKYKKIAANKDEINWVYQPSIQPSLNTLKQLKSAFEKDRVLRVTTLGPHRDDFNVIINNMDAKTSASRGEVRSISLALKLLEVDLNSHHFSTKPILLFDDVFSELDGKHRKTLSTNLKDNQSIITTTNADIALKLDTNASVKPI